MNRNSVSRVQLRNFNEFKDAAHVDRLLAEKLLALSDNELRSVAQWLPRHALTKVGLLYIEWVSNGVTVLEAGLWERPKDIYAVAVRVKTGGDPDVPATQRTDRSERYSPATTHLVLPALQHRVQDSIFGMKKGNTTNQLESRPNWELTRPINHNLPPRLMQRSCSRCNL